MLMTIIPDLKFNLTKELSQKVKIKFVFVSKSQMFVFNLLNFLFTFLPGAIAFEPSLIVKATDLDGPTQGNGQVYYSIKSVNTDSTIFDIDETGGEITLIRPARYIST